jgi:hypothetical protein
MPGMIRRFPRNIFPAPSPGRIFYCCRSCNRRVGNDMRLNAMGQGFLQKYLLTIHN